MLHDEQTIIMMSFPLFIKLKKTSILANAWYSGNSITYAFHATVLIYTAHSADTTLQASTYVMQVTVYVIH